VSARGQSPEGGGVFGGVTKRVTGLCEGKGPKEGVREKRCLF